MVFDWFQRRLRRTPSESSPGEAPSPEIATVSSGDLIDQETPKTTTLSPAPELTSAAAPELVAPAASPSAPAQGEDALAWAREVYARLKAQQESECQIVADAESTSGSGASQADQPFPVPAPDESEGSSASPSLLERAAAERMARQRDQRQRALEAPATPTAADVTEDQEAPNLGRFDSTFTWSAEVLAAQGRRADQVSLEEIDWLSRLRRGLEKTRHGFVTELLNRLGDDPLTPDVLEELEMLLLRADAGVAATDQAIEALRQRMNEAVVDSSEGLSFLKGQLRDLLERPIRESGVELLAPERDRLNVWLMAGVNGVGKTTTIGKLANLATRSGYSALIAAADTFRAAAVAQARIWGERSDVGVIANATPNADPAAVVFDAIGAARAKGIELMFVDTAGRLQTKNNLMEELSKIRRVIDRQAPEAIVESLLVLDASQGQNGLRQALAFARAASLTGVVITKLDGTARGGVALAVASEAGLPIRFIGAGEGAQDLRPFNSYEFVEALLAC